MKIGDILRQKGDEVVTIGESQTALDAVKLLVERNIGGLVVTKGERIVGIFTERDVLRLTARAPGDLGETLVGDVMTQDVITGGPDDSLVEVMDVMTVNRIRHLPVVSGGRLAGIITIGDLVNACRVSAESENAQLRQYIQGAG